MFPPCCLQEDGTLQQLHDSWIVSQDTGCQTYSQVRAAPLCKASLFQ